MSQRAFYEFVAENWKQTTGLKMVERKKLSFRVFTFFLLLMFSIAPLVTVSGINLRNVLGQMESMEAEYEGSLLEQRLLPVETRIHTYGELIRFVSQLPAVAEILDRGKTRPGSIEKDRALARYTGVITRAFRKYPDIVGVHIFDLQGKVRLHVKKQAGQSFQVETDSSDQFHYDQVGFRKALTQDGIEITVTPLALPIQTADGAGTPRLLLRMQAPIRLQNETIGVYVSDVDVGVLSQSFPEIHWVFSDGSYLSSQGSEDSAFARFPELKQVFSVGRAALTGEAPRMAWRPIYRGGEFGLVLWAGREVSLETVRSAKRRIYVGVAATVVVVGFMILFVAYRLSARMQKFFAGLLRSLESAMLYERHPSRPESTGLAEVDAFLEKVEVLTSAHERLEHEKQEVQRSLEQSEELLRVVTNAVQSAVMLIDDQDRIQFINPAAEALFGFSQEEMSGRKVHQTLTPERFREQARTGLANYFRIGEGPLLNRPLELVARRKDGSDIPIELYVGRVRKDDRWWAVGAAIDISERKAREQKLTRMAETDPLTGVDNRRNLVVLAEQELKRCRRYKLPLFFLMFDLDHFKAINDEFGHAVGDEVLRQFAGICTHNLRDSDLFGRMGGEEFASVMAGISREDVLGVAERIRMAFSHITIRDAEQTLGIDTSVSIGIASIDPATDTVESALKQADFALYKAKRQGRNRAEYEG